MIDELIANFKTLLYNNYYLIDVEEEEFLTWLDNNIDYDNGLLRVNTNTITEEEYSTSETGLEDLKNLVESLANSRYKKQLLWTSLLERNSNYTSGVLKII